MIRDVVISCGLILSVAAADAAEKVNPNAAIESYCVEKSVDDYESQRLCVKKNLEGQQAVSALRARYSEQSAENAIIERSIVKWFPRFDWVIERAQQQIDAFHLIQSQHATVGRALEACQRQWPDDFVMQHYCLQATTPP